MAARTRHADEQADWRKCTNAYRAGRANINTDLPTHRRTRTRAQPVTQHETRHFSFWIRETFRQLQRTKNV